MNEFEALKAENARLKVALEDAIGYVSGCIGQDGLLPGVDYVARGGKLVAA